MIAGYFREHHQLPEATVVMNATDGPGEQAYDGRLHEAARLAPETRILLYQGGYSPERGLGTLVQSAPHLPTGWALVLMGSGNSEPDLKRLAAEDAKTAARVRFIPPSPVEELADWTAGASLGAILYENTCLNHWYCSPNKLWEYPRAGVPILAVRFPVLAERIEKYQIGWLLSDPVTPGEVGRLVANLTEDELAAKRKNCRAFLEQDNWGLYEGRLCAMYERLFDQTTSPGERDQPPAQAEHLSSLNRNGRGARCC